MKQSSQRAKFVSLGRHGKRQYQQIEKGLCKFVEGRSVNWY